MNIFKLAIILVLSAYSLQVFSLIEMNKRPLDPAVCSMLESTVKEGDLIFTAVDTALYREVALVTNSWTTHVGVVVVENEELVIAESKVPLSKYSGICEFVGRSANHLFSLRRPSFPISEVEKLKLRLAAKSRMNKLYHLGFDYDSPRQYCSKFVYDSFNEAMSIKVGVIETVREIRDKVPDVDETFFKVWFFGSIPWEQRVVTPASQYLDDKFFTVIENI